MTDLNEKNNLFRKYENICNCLEQLQKDYAFTMWGGNLKQIENKFLDIISTIKYDKSSFEKDRRIKTR